MKVLIFGPSGSGKTFIANALKVKDINAVDDKDIPGLSNWYNSAGKKVTAPATAQEALANNYAFLWSVKRMAEFINQFEDVYVFGGAGNVASVFHLFDRVYFLKVSKAIQRQRLLNALRQTLLMDKNGDELVIWGDWFEQLATERQIPFIDAALTPDEILNIINGKR